MSGRIPTGVLGLGLIGATWARHLEEDGWLAGAWNRTAKPAFPRWQPTPAGVAEVADVLIVCVSDPPAVAAVLDALADALGERHTLVQCSTIDPVSSARFERQVRSRGAAYLEAPFSGSKPGADSRRTVFYLGGDPAAIERATPVLARLSQHRPVIGAGPHVALLKLASNLQITAQVQALCEALRWSRAAGVPDDTFFAMLRGNMAWSGVHEIKGPKVRAGDFAPQFATRHMLKDLKLAIAASPTPLPLGQALADLLERAVSRGWADEDFSALYKLPDP